MKKEPVYCFCGCGKEIIRIKSGNHKEKRFSNEKCKFNYNKKLAKEGKLPPDYYTRCSVCNKWFPCWFFLNSKIPPRSCSSKDCKGKAISNSLNKYFKKTKPSTYKKIKLKEAKQFGFSYKKAVEVRKKYCNGIDGSGVQCSFYSECLSPVLETGVFMLQYFITKGTCYEYPEDYNGIRRF